MDLTLSLLSIFLCSDDIEFAAEGVPGPVSLANSEDLENVIGGGLLRKVQKTSNRVRTKFPETWLWDIVLIG